MYLEIFDIWKGITHVTKIANTFDALAKTLEEDI